MLSDYPAPEVLANIQANVARNLEPRRKGQREQEQQQQQQVVVGEVRVQGHEWGVLDNDDDDGRRAFSVENRGAFGKVLVADCLWMPWQHGNLLRSIGWFLAAGGRALVVAGFHTRRDRLRGFFEEAALREAGLEIERIWERNADSTEREWVMDRGIEDVTVMKRWLVVAILRRTMG